MNADIAGRTPATADVDHVRFVFETNVFGVITVTSAFLPLLRRSDSPRIVNVSSSAGSRAAISDLNGHRGFLTPAEGARSAVTVATIPADGPTGTFTDADGPVGW